MKKVLFILLASVCAAAPSIYQTTPWARYYLPKKPAPVYVAPAKPAPAPVVTQSASQFVPLTKAELLTSLKRSIDNATLYRDITILGGAHPDSPAVRYFTGRIEAFTTAYELADLLP